MSYNIHHGTDAQENDRLDSIALFIKASGADLIGLQEVDSVCRRSGNIDQMQRLASLTGMHYAFVRHRAYDGGAYGQGVLSRYPISDIRNDRLSIRKADGTTTSTALLSAKIQLPNNQQLVFANAHFALEPESRLIQAEEVIAHLQPGQCPVILTGDLNAEPETAEIKRLKRYFTDVSLPGQLTFPADTPVKTIDYILVSNMFPYQTAVSTVFPAIHHSDHLPIMGTITLK
ncbi:endonuclease/exonuclease/phosphatase family protein [Parapedobacter sp. 10938]|uniref:endonuclease/exonuclease/phosphatase family protein n=1 Tax=Parapedobacter flavus TaxID=3110225 RepID=UPI002DBC591A|nr:endonuclease/exonuclease/phosphatase family protein [Parapedobacter sp. 10938]MEC3880091.1 endonuclease/exonuclease/phosphatase family protein [Parapedobacter sp. 10938]